MKYGKTSEELDLMQEFNQCHNDFFVEEYEHIVWTHIHIIEANTLGGRLENSFLSYKNR